jgi:ectoine hydroxylase-related dioxygenase (phytanoyl-CoA dioxygenase family)
LRKFQFVSRYDDVFAAHLRTPEVSGVLSSVLGDSFVAYSDIVFMKPPEVGSRQPYHQDRVLDYHINDEARMAGLWLALDPATEANGCLRFIPGTHKKRLTRDEAAVIEQEALGPGIDTEAIVEAGVGDAILIDSLVLHASEPNHSKLNRWAYSCFCVSCDAMYTGDEESKPDFLLVQGSRKPGRI